MKKLRFIWLVLTNQLVLTNLLCTKAPKVEFTISISGELDKGDDLTEVTIESKENGIEIKTNLAAMKEEYNRIGSLYPGVFGLCGLVKDIDNHVQRVRMQSSFNPFESLERMLQRAGQA